MVLLISRAQRQDREPLRYGKKGNKAIDWPVPLAKEDEGEVESANGSRIVVLPGRNIDSTSALEWPCVECPHLSTIFPQPLHSNGLT
jgi:hypothetical protein